MEERAVGESNPAIDCSPLRRFRIRSFLCYFSFHDSPPNVMRMPERKVKGSAG